MKMSNSERMLSAIVRILLKRHGKLVIQLDELDESDTLSPLLVRRDLETNQITAELVTDDVILAIAIKIKEGKELTVEEEHILQMADIDLKHRHLLN